MMKRGWLAVVAALLSLALSPSPAAADERVKFYRVTVTDAAAPTGSPGWPVGCWAHPAESRRSTGSTPAAGSRTGPHCSTLADCGPAGFSSCHGTRWARVSRLDRYPRLHLHGAAIVLATCTGGAAQRFTLNRSHDLVNVPADRCVDVVDEARSDGARLQLWDCAGTDNQKWSR
jgi:hypothetical protein